MQAAVGGRRGLALGEAVDLVVHDDQRHVDVLDHRVHEVFHADGVGVAVAAKVDDLEAGVGDRYADGYGQGAAVLALVGVDLELFRLLAGATDAAQGEHVLQRYAYVVNQAQDDLFDCSVNAEVATTAAPPGAVAGDVSSLNRDNLGFE